VTSVISFEEAVRAAGEEALGREAAALLMRARPGDELNLLMAEAARLRDRLKGNVITYSRKVFIPLTNLCRDYCGYCAFRKDPGDPDSRTMTPDNVLGVARAGERLGCKEALFSLGDRPEAIFSEMRRQLQGLGHKTTLSYLGEMTRRVLGETSLLPHSNPGLMARRDMEALRRSNPSLGLMLETISERLSLPGMPHDNAPDKRPLLRLKVLEQAGLLRIPFTTGILIGIGETLDERVDSLLAIRELHARFGHIQEVIIQNFRSKPDIPMRNHPEPDLTDLARTIAVARLILREMNLQAPPNLSDDNYQFLIHAGINDWGGISPLTRDYINPEKPWPHIETLRERTEAAGMELSERLSVYPEYVHRDDFLDPAVAETVRSMADANGYARIQ